MGSTLKLNTLLIAATGGRSEWRRPVLLGCSRVDSTRMGRRALVVDAEVSMSREGSRSERSRIFGSGWGSEEGVYRLPRLLLNALGRMAVLFLVKKLRRVIALATICGDVVGRAVGVVVLSPMVIGRFRFGRRFRWQSLCQFVSGTSFQKRLDLISDLTILRMCVKEAVASAIFIDDRHVFGFEGSRLLSFV